MQNASQQYCNYKYESNFIGFAINKLSIIAGLQIRKHMHGMKNIRWHINKLPGNNVTIISGEHTHTGSFAIKPG